ncbi:MAG: DUF5615 family PIN-like protein [Deltaproteobacteria bacterium]|jgi:hypothetical protein|nr:DUF5615 family PIN-like protein [Deltaproteobacteria bacterium]
MTWKKIDFSKREWRQINSELALFRKQVRFLVDENVPEDLISVLRERGYNTKAVTECELKGRDDKEIFGLARKENRVLVTQDKDFLNDKRFPIQRNPGLAVLPAYSENEDGFVTAFGHLLTIHGDSHELWYEQKAHFSGDDTVSIRCRDASTSGWTTVKFKFPKNGTPMVWEND